ncbi:MAG TPA: response regulator, partial [Chloroflexota bacterium]|nr:response regulator [Chloroflexota bacterium]
MVEDSPVALAAFQHILRRQGHDVTAVADGEAALALCQQEAFSLILLDLVLPGVDGVTLCRRIRGLPHGQRSVILLTSSSDHPQDLAAILDAGAYDYLPKSAGLALLALRLEVAARHAAELGRRLDSEARLRESEHRLQMVIENAPIMLTAIDADGIVTFSNGRDVAGGGQRAQSTVGRSAFEALADVPEALEYVRRALAGERCRAILHVRGAVTETHYVPVCDAEGLVTGALTVSTDITDNWQAEDARRASEARFRALSAQATDLVAIVDTRGAVLYASPSHQSVLGFLPEAIEAHQVLDTVHADDMERMQAAFAACLADAGSLTTVELRLRHADGSWRSMESVMNNRLDDPVIQGVIVTSRDVSV